MNPAGTPRDCPGCGEDPIMPVTLPDGAGPHCPVCGYEFGTLPGKA